METFYIYNNLSWLNGLPDEDALIRLRSCAGSDQWAQGMVAARPFRMLETLYEAVGAVWFSLAPSEWMSAFDTLINDSKAADEEETEIGQATRLYREKFGFIFVVCESGKTPEEVLAICKARLGNSSETELQIASEEYCKIIEARLSKILEQ